MNSQVCYSTSYPFIIKIMVAGQMTMFSLQNNRRPVKKSENLNKYSPFFIIFPLPIMLKFTAHFTSVYLFTCVAKAVTSQRSRDINLSKFLKIHTNKMACKPNRLRSACALVHADSKDSDQTMSGCLFMHLPILVCPQSLNPYLPIMLLFCSVKTLIRL